MKPPADINFTSTPQAKDEGAALSCTLPAGQPVNYAMGTPSSNVNGTMTEGFGVSVSGEAFVRDIPPLPDIPLFTVGPFTLSNLFSLLTGAFNTITLTGSAQNVDLGNLLPNVTAPTVVMDTIPTNGTEGNPIAAGGQGHRPGRQPQPVR